MKDLFLAAGRVAVQQVLARHMNESGCQSWRNSLFMSIVTAH